MVCFIGYVSEYESNQVYTDINEALGRNFATPDDIDEADLDAELEMLCYELEEELQEEAAVADASVPSYLMPSTPNEVPGAKEDSIPAAPIGNP